MSAGRPSSSPTGLLGRLASRTAGTAAVLCAVALVPASLSAMSPSAETRNAASSGPSLEAAWLRDARGLDVSAGPPARRIVTLAPSLAGLVDAVGAGDRLVGVSDHTRAPARARSLPVVAAPGRVDLERIVSLQPDLVLAWLSGNPGAALDRIAALGMRVFAVESRRMEDIPAALRAIGALTATEDTAEARARQFEQELARLPAVAGHPRVFIEIWHAPLMTVDRSHLMSDVVRRCGGENVFSHLPAPAAVVSLETLYRLQPDVILAASEAMQADDPRAEWSSAPLLGAVRAGRVAVIDPAAFTDAGVGILSAAREVCAALAHATDARSPLQ